MPSKACLEKGCANPATYRGRCRAHARLHEDETERAGGKEYSTKRWYLLRRQVLYEQSICAVEGCERLSMAVDHVKPLAAGGEMYDRANLQGLCYPHHSIKTREERG